MGNETRLEKALEGFHHRAVRQMTGMGTKRQRDGTWVYPPIDTALAMVGLYEIGMYIVCQQNTVAQYIATRPIMQLCLAEERNPGMRLSRRWWKQPGMDILGIRAGHSAEEVGGGDGYGVIGGRGRVG